MYRPPDIDNFNDFWTYYRNRWLALPVDVVRDRLQTRGLSFEGVTCIPVKPEDVGGPNSKDYEIHLRAVIAPSGITERIIVNYSLVIAAGIFGRPQGGMVPYGPTAAFVTRGSPRAAHRGLRTPAGRELFLINGFGARGQEPPEHALIWSCFNPKWESFEEALVRVTGGTLGVPVAQDWALARGDTGETLLWFRQSPVARVNKRTIEFYAGAEEQAMLLELEEFIPHDRYKILQT